MTRKYNITDMEIYRRSFSNALFNTHFKSFDNIFRMADISSIPELFVDERLDNNLSSLEYYNRFKMAPIIKTQEELKTYLGSNNQLGSIYFLVGKRGVGKSTILRSYFNNHNHDIISLPLVLDLFGMTTSRENVENYIWDKIYHSIKSDERTRLYFDEIDYAKKIRPIFKHLENDKIAELIILDRITYAKEVLLYLSKINRIYLVIDNTDELGLDMVLNITKVGYSIAKDFPMRVIFALREYWENPVFTALKRQIQFNVTYLPPPKIAEIIKRRIDKIQLDRRLSISVDYVTRDESGSKVSGTKAVTIEDAELFLKEVINEAFSQESEICNNLYKMCNYDIREVLDNIYNFFHSCTLPLAQLFQKIIVKKIDAKKRITFGDFIRCLATIHTVFYDYKSSRLFNIFDMNRKDVNDNYRNTLGLLRILQRCSIGESVKLDAVISDFIKLGYSRDKLYEALRILLEDGLLETTESLDLSIITELKLSEKGNFYINELVYKFDYLLYIQDRVPMPVSLHIPVEAKFGEPHSKVTTEGDWYKRKQSVINFIDFISSEEDLENTEYFDKQKDVLQRIRGGKNTKISDEMRDKTYHRLYEIDKAVQHSKIKHDIEFTRIEPQYPKIEPAIDHGTHQRNYHDA